MNININNNITISVNEGVDIEKLNIRYVGSYKPSSVFSNNLENGSKTSFNGQNMFCVIYLLPICHYLCLYSFKMETYYFPSKYFYQILYAKRK